MSNRMQAAPNVAIMIEEVGGDLSVRGWARDEIKLSGDQPRAGSGDDGQSVRIRCAGDLQLNVPTGATLTIEEVGGDAKITEVAGAIQIHSVGGDLKIRDCGPVRVSAVGGDLNVRQVNGEFHVDDVGGDALVFSVSEAMNAGNVGGDAYFRDLHGDCVCDQVGSDLILQIAYSPERTYLAQVGGDIVCRMDADANVTFRVMCQGDLAVETESAQVNSHNLEDDDEHEADVIYGEGKASVRLEANGDIRFVDDVGFEPLFNGDFEAAFDIDVDRIIEQSTLAAERARAQAERIRDQVTREAQRVADEMRRQAERAAEEMRREAKRTEKGKRGYSWSWSWDDGKMKRGMGYPTPPNAPTPPRPPVPPVPPTPPMPPLAPSEPVSNEERMLILRMVEAKQISVEEAEKLLAALEGRV